MPILENCPQIVYLDEEDCKIANEHRWHMHHSILKTYIGKKRYSIFEIVFGTDSSGRVLVKNGVPYDYRRENIRICDKTIIKYLSSAKRETSSNYYGVVKSKKVWAARVYRQDTCTYEVFHTEYLAAVAADYNAMLRYGEFALRNFPDLSFEELKEIRDKAIKEMQENKSINRSIAVRGVKYREDTQAEFIGVTPASNSSWDARTTYLGERIYIGRFYSKEDAGIAYDFKTIELIGDTDKRNFPNMSREEITDRYNEILKTNAELEAFRSSVSVQGRKIKTRVPTSKYKGVSLNRRKNLWTATITYNGHQMFLGYHENELSAALAYDAKAYELYGDHAKVNFSDEVNYLDH